MDYGRGLMMQYEVRGFCNQEMHFGMPVTVVKDPVYGNMAETYDGKRFSGILLNNVIDIDLTESTPYWPDVQVGSLVRIGTVGCEVRLPIVGELGQYIKPKLNGEWKITNKRKKGSVGQITRAFENCCDVRLI